MHMSHSLQCLHDETHADLRMLGARRAVWCAIECALSVADVWTDPWPREALMQAQAWVEGTAVEPLQLHRLATAAYDAARESSTTNAYYATWAVGTALTAAGHAAADEACDVAGLVVSVSACVGRVANDSHSANLLRLKPLIERAVRMPLRGGEAMPLKEFVWRERKLLQEFEAYWLKQQAADPESGSFPDKMLVGDWAEQLDFYRAQEE